MNLKKGILGLVLLGLVFTVSGWGEASSFEFALNGKTNKVPITAEVQWDSINFAPTTSEAISEAVGNNNLTIKGKPITSMVYLSFGTWMLCQKGLQGYLEQVPLVSVSTPPFTSSNSELDGTLSLTSNSKLECKITVGQWGSVPPLGTSVPKVRISQIPIAIQDSSEIYLINEDHLSYKIKLLKTFNFEKSFKAFAGNIGLPQISTNEYRATILTSLVYLHKKYTEGYSGSPADLVATVFTQTAARINTAVVSSTLTSLRNKLETNPYASQYLYPLTEYIGKAYFGAVENRLVQRFPTNKDLKGELLYSTLANLMNSVQNSQVFDVSSNSQLAEISKRYLFGLNRNYLNRLESLKYGENAYIDWMNSNVSLPAEKDLNYLFPELNYSLSVSSKDFFTSQTKTNSIIVRILNSYYRSPGIGFAIIPTENVDLLSEENVTNYSQIRNFLGNIIPSSSNQNSGSTNSITVNLKPESSVQSLLFWGSGSFVVESVQSVDGVANYGSKYTKWTLEQKDNLAYHLTAQNVQPIFFNAPSIYSVDLGSKTSSFKVTYRGQLYKVRAYSNQLRSTLGDFEWSELNTNFSGNTIANQTINYRLTSKNTRAVNEVQILDTKYLELGFNSYFIESEYLTSVDKNGSFYLNPKLSWMTVPINPVTFSGYGLETPKSYNEKLLGSFRFPKDSHFKNAFNTYFPSTELDYIDSASNPIDQSYLYKNRRNPTFNNLSLQAVYPYSSGVYIPNKNGVIIDPYSPFYADKIAGVDSFGLLISSLAIQKRINPNNSMNFDNVVLNNALKALGTRESLISVPFSIDPFVSSFSQGYYNWRSQVGNVESWISDNSIPLVDSPAQVGDILVGRELDGRLSVAIVISGAESVENNTTVKVISINPSLKRAVVAPWYPVGEQQSFTAIPDAYHLRRLLKTPVNLNSQWIKRPQFTQPIFTFSLDGRDLWYPWISNEHEIHPLGRAIVQSDSNILNKTSWSIKARDAGFLTQKAVGNLTNNYSPSANPAPNELGQNGSTEFFLIALANEYPFPIQNFEMKQNLDSNNWRLWDLSGSPIDGVVVARISTTGGIDLKTEIDTRYEYRFQDNVPIVIDLKRNKVFSFFAIVAQNSLGSTKKAYPGDDLEIAFTYGDSANLTTTAFGKSLQVFSPEQLVATSDQINRNRMAFLAQKNAQENSFFNVALKTLRIYQSISQIPDFANSGPIPTSVINYAELKALELGLHTVEYGYHGAAIVIGLTGIGSPISIGMEWIVDPSYLTTTGGMIEIASAAVPVVGKLGGYIVSKTGRLLTSYSDLAKVQQYIVRLRKPSGSNSVEEKLVPLLPEHVYKLLGYSSSNVPAAMITNTSAQKVFEDAIYKYIPLNTNCSKADAAILLKKAFSEIKAEGYADVIIEDSKRLLIEKVSKEFIADKTKIVALTPNQITEYYDLIGVSDEMLQAAKKAIMELGESDIEFVFRPRAPGASDFDATAGKILDTKPAGAENILAWPDGRRLVVKKDGTYAVVSSDWDLAVVKRQNSLLNSNAGGNGENLLENFQDKCNSNYHNLIGNGTDIINHFDNYSGELAEIKGALRAAEADDLCFSIRYVNGAFEYKLIKYSKATNAAAKVAIDVARATEKQLDDIFLTIVDHPPRSLIPNTIEHKAQRWAQYKIEKGDNAWSYERWSNTYNSNVTKQKIAEAIELEYMKSIGWGEHQVSITVGTGERRFDIADELSGHAVEVKAYETGKVYASADIRKEVAADAYLVKNQGWTIEWVFKSCGFSGPLKTLLDDAGIIIKEIP